MKWQLGRSSLCRLMHHKHWYLRTGKMSEMNSSAPHWTLTCKSRLNVLLSDMKASIHWDFNLSPSASTAYSFFSFLSFTLWFFLFHWAKMQISKVNCSTNTLEYDSTSFTYQQASFAQLLKCLGYPNLYHGILCPSRNTPSFS